MRKCKITVANKIARYFFVFFFIIVEMQHKFIARWIYCLTLWTHLNWMDFELDEKEKKPTNKQCKEKERNSRHKERQRKLNENFCILPSPDRCAKAKLPNTNVSHIFNDSFVCCRCSVDEHWPQLKQIKCDERRLKEKRNTELNPINDRYISDGLCHCGSSRNRISSFWGTSAFCMSLFDRVKEIEIFGQRNSIFGFAFAAFFSLFHHRHCHHRWSVVGGRCLFNVFEPETIVQTE